MNRPILAYGLGARPVSADEGDTFILIDSGEKWTFTNGEWVPENTPSTPEKVLCEECVVDLTEEAPKPKKKRTTKKK